MGLGIQLADRPQRRRGHDGIADPVGLHDEDPLRQGHRRRSISPVEEILYRLGGFQFGDGARNPLRALLVTQARRWR